LTSSRKKNAGIGRSRSTVNPLGEKSDNREPLDGMASHGDKLGFKSSLEAEKRKCLRKISWNDSGERIREEREGELKVENGE